MTNVPTSFENDLNKATDVREKLNVQEKPADAKATNFELLRTEPFHVPFWRMDRKLLLKQIFEFLSKGLFFALNNSCNVVVILINFMVIGYLKDPLL